MGTVRFLDLIRFMDEEIKTYRPFTGKRILWIHLIPYYQESLKQYFNNSKKYQLLAGDIIFDFADTLVPEDPFHSLTRKLIKNVYNGSYSHKAQAIGKLTDMLDPDAVIHFYHWGCKRASGGNLALKRSHEGTKYPDAHPGR
ncbi:MAG: 2-hydroxyacyl-CoA dehydratase family protein [Frisingicoccus sp.]